VNNFAYADKPIDKASELLEQNLRQFMQQNPQFSRYEIKFLPITNKSNCNNYANIRLLNHDFLSGNVRIVIDCNDEGFNQITLRAQVVLYHKILQARHTLKRGQPITSNDFVVKEIKFNLINALAITPNTNLDNLIAGKNIATGNILRISMLKPKVLIHKNDEVKVIMQYPNAEFTVNAVALDDGGLNQQIKLRNMSSKKIIRAYVIKSGYAKIYGS